MKPIEMTGSKIEAMSNCSMPGKSLGNFLAIKRFH